jgi:DNA-binding NtrC family response regulator
MTKRVLMVDDEPDLLRAYGKLFSRHKDRFVVTTACSGAAALIAFDAARAAGADFDVVITDMRMPRMSGAVLLHELALRGNRCKTILLSGYAEQDLLAQAVALHAIVLEKPCEWSALFSAIESDDPADAADPAGASRGS